MSDQETLLELTESYLKTLISETANKSVFDTDPVTPFQELGIDSFHVLQIIKKLEEDFGTLPKTLLFENFNIHDLAKYFVSNHSEALQENVLNKLEKPSSAPAASKPEIKLPASPSPKPATPSISKTGFVAKDAVIILEKDATDHSELGTVVRNLFQSYKNEGSVSRGTRNIAPHLFIGSERRGYFNFSKSKKIILVYAFTGPLDYFETLANEIYHYCLSKDLELNIFYNDELHSIGNIPFTATPFGVVQRIGNLQEFSLKGNKMRRLRYQVSKFEDCGVGKTVEYKCGTDKETDQSIASIIDRWCEARTMVNPLIHIVKEEILAGSLSPEHRIFLTYLDDVLQNAILISYMSAEENGYLMDLEFYPKEMPLGGLEFAIVNIIETLVQEGCTLLSLGGTYGCKLAPSSNPDQQLDRILDHLREQNIFNDEGNLQFKNKFRPENITIYLCRSVENSSPDNVTDIIMMIADPSKLELQNEGGAGSYETFSITHEMAAATTEDAPATSEVFEVPQDGEQFILEDEPRSIALSDHGYNPLNIPDAHVEFDLKTDSWAQLENAFITNQMRYLHSRLQEPANLDENLRKVFPFQYFTLTTSGRTAESILCKAWEKKGVVLQNLLFPTTIFHQIDKGFTPVEVPDQKIFQLDCEDVFKGNLDWEATEKRVNESAQEIAFAWIEVNDNGAGGYPVSIAHLKRLKSLLSSKNIPLVIDATRIVENAQFIIENEKEFFDSSVWDVVKHIFSFADAVSASLTKDFCVNKGGLIATNDEKLFHKLQALSLEEGCALDQIEKKVIALSLQNLQKIENHALRRMKGVRLLWNALKQQSVPVVEPAGGHCVLIDVKQIPEFQNFKFMTPSFLAWLYVNTGIRAGAHSAGMQKDTPLNGTVRLAIPIGWNEKQIETMAERLVSLFDKKQNIPEIALASNATEAYGDIHSEYVLQKYHNPSASVVSRASAPPEFDKENKKLVITETGKADNGRIEYPAPEIAVVGMAGRYPKSENLNELWKNLLQGEDCIEMIPDSRMEQRLHNEFTKKYRGGFIDVDKFDSMFFNISPREAEMLDPQERLFLEVAWEAVEDAGYYPETLSSKDGARDIGVFVGAVWTMYQMIGPEEKLLGNDINPVSFFWSIANRVSYWMNFTGPSLTLDTACSSSLTAMYLACESIRKGECSAAIVGGVNLDLHQSKWDINWAGGTGPQSKDGVCRSFGKGANGYVAGEGVGAIVLKPLDDALRAGDHVYGVIKSVVVNHGGKTGGFMVPNPNAQRNLVKSALEKAQIDARTIGYIEAHGTGTELGDPIEISGLNGAFEGYNVDKQSCPIGSVKTNIGHLEAAAGVVGVQKVLLQMKHRKLVPSLHSAELNPYIDFENSPFYVGQTVENWEPKTVDGQNFPLRAGISSFGAGGSNAHIIIEEYNTPVKTVDPDENGEKIFPLSARNEDRLHETAIRLEKFLSQDNEETDRNALNDIAYTLQFGRKSFDYRLAIIAKSKEELTAKLRDFIDGKNDENIISGNIRNVDGITGLLNRKEKEDFIKLISQSQDPRKLAKLWTDGVLADWHGGPIPSLGQKISLPTYPFAKKRHWAPVSQGTKNLASNLHRGIHPLIDMNASTFERQIFRKTFSDKEFFGGDFHAFDTPAVTNLCLLEMVRKAGELAKGDRVFSIQEIIWNHPISTKNPRDVFIEMMPDGDSVLFDIFSEEEDLSYAQGAFSYASSENESSRDIIDIQGLLKSSVKVLDKNNIYALLPSVDLRYDHGFQVVEEIYENGEEILARLKLPENRKGDIDDYLLHPSVLEGALQSLLAYDIRKENAGAFLPASIKKTEIYGELPQNCYCSIKRQTLDGKFSSADILFIDEDGKVLVKIEGLIGEPLQKVRQKLLQGEDAEEYEKLYYTYKWEQASGKSGNEEIAEPIIFFDSDDTLFHQYTSSLGKTNSHNAALVLPAESYLEEDGKYFVNPENPEDFLHLLDSFAQKGISFHKICFRWSLPELLKNGNVVEEALERGIYSFLYLCQAIIEKKVKEKVQLLYLYNAGQPHNEAINGFAKTLQIEHPKMLCKTVEIDQKKADNARIVESVLAEFHSQNQDSASVRYVQNVRYIKKLINYNLDEKQNRPADLKAGIKENGVYLITGGTGGLGMIFAEYLAKQCRASLVLSGRSKLSPGKEAELEELKKLGAKVLYVQADVAKKEDVDHIIREAKSQFGEIHGVIHCAGVLRDSFIKNKTLKEAQAVIAPKVHGTVYLDEATKEENLDFFVLFSSLASIGGNLGQADYAFANHFMDSFALSREALRKKKKRNGKTVSFNWSLWNEGGMQLDEQTEILFKKNLGIKPLSTKTGIEAFLQGLSIDEYQLAVVEGVREKIEFAWGLRKKEEPTVEVTKNVSTNSETADLSAPVQEEISQMVMDLLKIEKEEISADKILMDLGFDSLSMSALANSINEKYAVGLTPVLFFEYPSIQEIVKYLCIEHPNEVAKVHAPDSEGFESAIVAKEEAQPSVAQKPEIRRRFLQDQKSIGFAKRFSAESRFKDMPIAIVGIAGVFPQSDDVEEFWENLKNSENMVTEIPRERWIWEDYDGDPQKEKNKTNSKWGGFMKEVDKFDPLFFGISPREAEMMDPQQRIFLETVWKTIEDSGHKVSELSGSRTGLFVGASYRDYGDLFFTSNVELDAYSATGNTHSILANRISFLLNLHGPSAPLDTACSSSLIAVHRAVESIHTGSCDMAIAGGVQVILTPAAQISLGSAGMLSGDGKCKTFDKAADGYVRGEGSGAVFLKPLEKAKADGDHIYAVIKSTAENHGGQVTTLTAPNPNAQADLLIEAYEKAYIDPSTVGYIECHGTGTSLGDPIEIQGLKKAFSSLYQKNHIPMSKQSVCGLGTVKSNIGHLEIAAGVAGLIKVLLAIKHKQIPASLHFQELNPYINLNDSPFYIVDKSSPWNPVKDERGQELPRRAGVSSFGFGGANAHVVLEEYREENSSQENSGEPRLIVISAKNKERLQDYAQSILAYLKKYDINPAEFAYTLQAGREEMPERLAFVAADTAEVIRKLGDFLQDPEQAQSVFSNNIRTNKESIASLSQALAQNSLQAVMERNDLDALAKYWVWGEKVDWSKLYKNGIPKRISLPTYPFARERYWIKVPEEGDGTEISVAAALHPFVQRNVSTLSEQKFSTPVSAMKSYFVNYGSSESQSVLPWFLYPEIAKVAGELSVETDAQYFRNITWEAPLVKTGGEEITVSLYPEGKDVSVSIETEGAQHFHAIAGFRNLHELKVLNIDSLQERCSREVFTKSDVSSLLEETKYKPAHFEFMQKVFANESETLAVLDLPEELKSKINLSQRIIENAVYSSVAGYLRFRKQKVSFYIPSFASRLEYVRALSDAHYVYAVWSEGSVKDTLAKMNLYLLDEDGNVLLQLKDLLLKEWNPQSLLADSDASIMYFENVWKKQSLLVSADSALGNSLIFCEKESLANAIRLKLENDSAVCTVVRPGKSFREIKKGLYEIHPESSQDYRDLFLALLKENRFPENVIHAWSQASGLQNEKSFDKEMENGIFSLFRLTQAFMEVSKSEGKKKSRGAKTKLFYVFEDHEMQPHLAAVSGFAKSVSLENPSYIFKTLEFKKVKASESLGDEKVANAIAEELKEDSPIHREIRYQSKERFIKDVEELDAPDSLQSNLKEKGVYIITGGAGGLGFLFAEHLAKQVKARLAITGRSPLGDKQKGIIQKLESFGSEVVYMEADISKFEDVENVVKETKKRFGEIHGILHCAGVLRDSLLLNKTVQDMQDVFAAKVRGTMFLDKATEKENLDFFALFSSISALKGNAGQSDYAYANSFMDNYAEYRNSLQKSKRSGKTISFNWPLWKEGGMGIDKDTEEFLEKTKGIKALETSAGLQAFHDGLVTNANQILVLQGDRRRILRSQMQRSEKENVSDTVLQKPKTDVAQLHELVKKDLLQLVIKTLKIKEDIFSFDVEMSEYGFDSISLTLFFRELSEKYSLDLTPAIFYEYPTLGALSEFLSEEYADQFARYFNTESGPKEPAQAKAEYSKVAKPVKNRFAALEKQNGSRNAPIAIVGMAGVMPQSENLEEFWNNLLAEKDLITEVPPDRWDWEAYQGNPLTEKNKTNCKWGGFMKEVDKFDAGFFGISAEEANFMDPQQRIFLETVWKTVEDAGHSPADLAGSSTGVFVGVGSIDYADILRENRVDVVGYTATGMAHSLLPNRISYLFDLHGPSEPVDTACSSSLVAIHRAVEAIHAGNCEMAIAGGVNALLSPSLYVSLGSAGALSTDGRCKTFDKRADGYVRGEGAGAIFLKSLDRAHEDGNHIYGIIKATGVNHGGHATSLTAPNPNAQAELLIDVFEKAQVDPKTVGYMEAHGTGTLLGDSIEINGLKKAFHELEKRRNSEPPKEPYCGIGTVKTNIGHLETASGIAGVIKVLSSMKHKRIPGNIHFQELNPHIRLDESPFFIVDKTKTWEAFQDDYGNNMPLRAGVSSFGFGGVNAHLILEEYVSESEDSFSAPAQDYKFLVPLSAANERRLKQKCSDLIDYIQNKNSSSSLQDISAIAYTLQVGRFPMEERICFLTGSLEDLTKKLQAYLKTDSYVSDTYRGQAKDKKAVLSVFDDDISVLVDHWIQNEQYGKIAEFWSKGLELDWNLLHKEGKPPRISLPTYPFSRDRYWADNIEDKSAEKNMPKVSSNGGENREEAGYQDELYFSSSQSKGEDGLSIKASEKIELFLKQEISKQLQIPVGEIQANLTFIELGIGSIGIINLIQKTSSLLEEDFSPGVFFEYRDIPRFANYLAETFPDKINALHVSRRPGSNGGQEKKRKKSGKKTTSDILIPIQKDGNKPAIFAIPGADGSSLSFLQLSQALGNDQPFYGLDASEVDEKTPAKTVEEIANINIEAIKSLKIEGTFGLLGYSNGGAIAYEMTKKLLESETKLDFLVLLDSLCPLLKTNDLTDPLDSIVQVSKSLIRSFSFGKSIDLNANNLRQVSPENRAEYLYKVIRDHGVNLSKEQFVGKYNSSHQMFAASEEAVRRYNPEKLNQDMDVFLFRASEGFIYGEDGIPEDYGWNQLLKNPAHTFDVKANHFNMIEKDAIRKVAEMIHASKTKLQSF